MRKLMMKIGMITLPFTFIAVFCVMMHVVTNTAGQSNIGMNTLEQVITMAGMFCMLFYMMCYGFFFLLDKAHWQSFEAYDKARLDHLEAVRKYNRLTQQMTHLNEQYVEAKVNFNQELIQKIEELCPSIKDPELTNPFLYDQMHQWHKELTEGETK